jgi:hypothetical protein
MEDEAIIIILFLIGALFALVIAFAITNGNKEEKEEQEKAKRDAFYAKYLESTKNPAFEKLLDELEAVLFKHGEKRSREELKELAKSFAGSSPEEILVAVYKTIPTTVSVNHFYSALDANLNHLFDCVVKSYKAKEEFQKVRLKQEDVTDSFVNSCISAQIETVILPNDDVTLFRFNYEQLALSLILLFLETEMPPCPERGTAIKHIKEYAEKSGYFSITETEASETVADEEVQESEPCPSHTAVPISEAPSTLSCPNTQNAKRLLAMCESYIDKYEVIAPNKLIPTSKYDLMKRIKKQVEADKEIPTWKEGDVDYDKIANVLLANASFDLLASGVYHIHAGTLNPMNCSGKMMAVYNGAMKWSVENGYNDEKTRQEQYDYLLKCISEVG